MIRVVCACGRTFKAEDRHAGRPARCPECGADLTIGPANPPAGSMATTWSGSNPDAEVAFPSVVTGSNDEPGGPLASGQPGPGGLGAGVGKSGILVGAGVAVLLLAIGSFLWLHRTPPEGGVAAPGPRGTAPIRPEQPGAGPAAGAKAGRAGNPADPPPPAPTADVKGLPANPRAGASPGLRMLVPAYIYPAGDGRKEWQRLIDAASRVELVVVVNPSSGPGTERDPEYDAIFTEASRRNITLVGYVSTDFGKRPRNAIEDDVDAWVRLYPQVRGIFFDQQPSESRHAALFVALRDAVKRKMRDPLVITNPGVLCDPAYLDRSVSDVTCVFVNFRGFDGFDLPATFKPYDASHFAAMPYNIPDADAMRDVLKEAILKRIGYLYISDARPDNAWGRLPAYWEAEVEAIARFRR